MHNPLLTPRQIYIWEIKLFLGSSVSFTPFFLYRSSSSGNFATISFPFSSTSFVQWKQIFWRSLAFSVPASSLCWSSTWSSAFLVKSTLVLPTVFLSRISVLVNSSKLCLIIHIYHRTVNKNISKYIHFL